MKAEFISAKATSQNHVECTFECDDGEFTVEWSNIRPDGEIDDVFDLGGLSQSDNESLSILVDQILFAGENDAKGGADCELYLSIRDGFDADRVAELAESFVEIIDTDTHLDHCELVPVFGQGCNYETKKGIDGFSVTFKIEEDGEEYSLQFDSKERQDNVRGYCGYEMGLCDMLEYGDYYALEEAVSEDRLQAIVDSLTETAEKLCKAELESREAEFIAEHGDITFKELESAGDEA